MKKTIRLIALSMVLIMAVLALASCGGPNADPDKAKEALEKEDYNAIVIDSGLIFEGYKKLGGKLEAVLLTVADEKLAIPDGKLVVLYYETADDAKEAFEGFEDLAKEEMEEDESKYEIKQSGKMIWFGLKEAVKAAA